MENILYNELCYRGYRVDVGVVEIYGRDKETQKTTRNSYEVDFVATKGRRKAVFAGRGNNVIAGGGKNRFYYAYKKERFP